jgi:hypothetical protein
MGLEKMVLKKHTLIGTFIADQKHPFFEGETFHSVLRAVQAQPRRFKVYEKAGTLSAVRRMQDVKNVQGAMEAMEGGHWRWSHRIFVKPWPSQRSAPGPTRVDPSLHLPRLANLKPYMHARSPDQASGNPPLARATMPSGRPGCFPASPNA